MVHYTHAHDLSYPAPKGTVLLLSCMDPRLLDDTVDFMNHDNLENRYDHVVLAGAALGALGGGLKKYEHWRKCFFDHLGAACELHAIEEVYILEHRHCGAYHKVFKVASEFGDTQEQMEEEAACHRKYAQQLEDEIESWAKKAKRKIRSRSFLMDLRGTVSLLTDAWK